MTPRHTAELTLEQLAKILARPPSNPEPITAALNRSSSHDFQAIFDIVKMLAKQGVVLFCYLESALAAVSKAHQDLLNIVHSRTDAIKSTRAKTKILLDEMRKAEHHLRHAYSTLDPQGELPPFQPSAPELDNDFATNLLTNFPEIHRILERQKMLDSQYIAGQVAWFLETAINFVCLVHRGLDLFQGDHAKLETLAVNTFSIIESEKMRVDQVANSIIAGAQHVKDAHTVLDRPE